LILCLPRAWLMWIIAAMIPLAPAVRLWSDHPMVSVLPTSCLDSLGLGALLACGGEPSSSPSRSIVWAGFWLGVPLLACAMVLRYLGIGGEYAEVGADFGVSLVAVWLVWKAVSGFRGVAGRIMEWPPLLYLGTISYGVYVYHAFMPYLLGRILGGRVQSLHWLSRFAILAAATILTASVSWRLLERPILTLKETYASRTRQSGQVASG
jgi:peptidoglycan/LPS O-acetylase OafA/YrhL